MKSTICAVAGLLAVSVAHAGPKYVEVWNPPEARLQHTSAARVPVKRHHVSLHPHQTKRTLHVVASARIAQPPAMNAETSRKPSFDEIPRQLTPEGNVLRVGGRQARAEVER